MGKIKRELEYQDLKNKLSEIGFEYNKDAKGKKGYIKCFHDDIYYFWVTVSFDDKKLYLYKEYDVGGCLCDISYDIPQKVLNHCDAFIDWLDQMVG